MSRGPGRLERAIADAFARDPSATFSTEDLGPICYPGVNAVEKKHRVAILRAADKVAARMFWGRLSYVGSIDSVYFNRCDLHSYALGQVRSSRDKVWTRGTTLKQARATFDGWDELWKAEMIVEPPRRRSMMELEELAANAMEREGYRRDVAMAVHERDGTTDSDEYRKMRTERLVEKAAGFAMLKAC